MNKIICDKSGLDRRTHYKMKYWTLLFKAICIYMYLTDYSSPKCYKNLRSVHISNILQILTVTELKRKLLVNI